MTNGNDAKDSPPKLEETTSRKRKSDGSTEMDAFYEGYNKNNTNNCYCSPCEEYFDTPMAHEQHKLGKKHQHKLE